MKAKYFTVFALFVSVAAATFFFRVERHAQARPINLSAVPADIGDWRMINQNTSVGKAEAKFLDDVLVRTYQRQDGKTMKLAVAYGADQRKNFSIHLPEVCYKASGCSVTSVGQSMMTSPNHNLKQMLAKKPDGGVEAVQYWIVLDGKVVTSDFDRKLKKAYYGFFGAEGGGVLVRVSSLSTDKDFQKDYEVQREFISDLYKNLNPELRRLLFGDKI